jgi:cyclopropane-fatty-acyl-phospholipid synthase
MLLSRLLHTTIRYGTLNLIDFQGRHYCFQGTPKPSVTVRLRSRTLERELYFNPDLALGEGFMDGLLTIEDGSLATLFEILFSNLEHAKSEPFFAFRSRAEMLLRRFQQFNPVSISRKNVALHYDLPDKIYDMFLDEDKQYSCAYFDKPGDDLSTAQTNKKRHLAAKLLLSPGQQILDIGSGWGGLALYLAQAGGGKVTGLTLSESQIKIARERARGNGLEQQVQFHLRDYRQENGTYDRIVSVGMFEHVGVNHHQQYFDTISELLADDGAAVVHSIGRQAGPSSTSQWIQKYIFPGGYSPALSETLAAVEKSGLWVTDIEILRLHYADTLKAWRRRFQANRPKIVDLLDERFCRMWEYYLTGSEATFRYGDHLVFQLQLAKKRDTVPLTRDYIVDCERDPTCKVNKNRPLEIA